MQYGWGSLPGGGVEEGLGLGISGISAGDCC